MDWAQGARELVKLILSTPEAAQGVRAVLAEDAFELIVDAVFRASQTPDEGRYPELTVYVPQFPKTMADRMLALKPRVFDAQLLRERSAAVPHRPYALVVTAYGGTPICAGVMKVVNRESGMTSIPFGLFIETQGPGHLVVAVHATDQQTWHFRLKAGAVSRVHDLTESGALNDVCRRAIVLAGESLPSLAVPAWEGIVAPTHPFQILRRALSSMCAEIIERGHGGAFFIADDEAIANLDIGHQTEPYSFSEDALRIHADQESKTRYARLRNFRERVRMVASLANIDGAVVFRRDLTVLGFGAFTPVGDPPTCLRVSAHVHWTRQEYRSEAFEASTHIGGARHKSAASLCSKHRNPVALVMSQDGHLHAFEGTDVIDDIVWVFGPAISVLGASARPVA